MCDNCKTAATNVVFDYMVECGVELPIAVRVARDYTVRAVLENPAKADAEVLEDIRYWHGLYAVLEERLQAIRASGIGVYEAYVALAQERALAANDVLPQPATPERRHS
jgi:hypothetical protein